MFFFRQSPIFAFILSALAAVTAGAADAVHFAVGERHTVRSKLLDRELVLLVHTPEGDEGDRPLPVLFVVGSDWRAQYAHLVSTVELLAAADRIPPMIVAGLDLPDGNGVLIPGRDPGEAPGAEVWLDAVADEVVPFVEKRWPAAPFRVLYGASNSGLFVVWALLERPEAFHAAVASSPMIGWCPDVIGRALAERMAAEAPGERALAVVWSDDDLGRVTGFVPAVAEKLAAAPTWLRWSVDEIRALGHVPPGDLALGLRTVFPGWAAPPAIDSAPALVAHFEGLQDRFGFPVPVPASSLFDLGFKAWSQKRYDAAREAFTAAAAVAPGDARGPAGLALVAQAEGKLDEARALAGKALEIDPESNLARRVLQRIEAAPEPSP